MSRRKGKKLGGRLVKLRDDLGSFVRNLQPQNLCKLDIQKAYDHLNKMFLILMMQGLWSQLDKIGETLHYHSEAFSPNKHDPCGLFFLSKGTKI